VSVSPDSSVNRNQTDKPNRKFSVRFETDNPIQTISEMFRNWKIFENRKSKIEISKQLC